MLQNQVKLVLKRLEARVHIDFESDKLVALRQSFMLSVPLLRHHPDSGKHVLLFKLSHVPFMDELDV